MYRLRATEETEYGVGVGLQSKSLVSIGRKMLLEVSLFEILSERTSSDSKYLHFGEECAAAPE